MNQVVINLIREFKARNGQKWKPLALELGSIFSRPQAALPDGTQALYLALNSPYVKEMPFRSVISFLLHLPVAFLRLSRLARRHNIKVFNVHFPDLEAINFLLVRDCRLFRGKVILSLHGSDLRSAHQERGISNWLWRILLRRADAVVSCSEGLKEEAVMLEPRCRAVTIHNGVDIPTLIAESQPTSHWPRQLERKRVLTSIASFEHRKGHDVLIQAFQKIVKCQRDVALLLVGKPGPVSGQVRQMIEDAQLESDVHILENVPHREIHDLLTRSAIFVLASRWHKGRIGEGFAIAILEAAAAGVPVVATASCGVRELIEDGVTGRVVPLEDHDALANAICEMLGSPLRAARMAENLRRLVSDRFTWRSAADKYLDSCRELAD